jgi:hypothetical protein
LPLLLSPSLLLLRLQCLRPLLLPLLLLLLLPLLAPPSPSATSS